MSLSVTVEIPRTQAKRKFVMPALRLRRDKLRRRIQVTDSVRHTVGKRSPVKRAGMDPGFHRGDDSVGMTEWGESRLQVDRFGTPRSGEGFSMSQNE